MATVGIYCDGFNVYYGLRHHLKHTGRCFYWLDIPAFALALAQHPPYGSSADTASVVKYFTADPTEPARKTRHQHYFDTIRGLAGVDIIDGRHAEKTRTCQNCGYVNMSHEEKETDVSVGVHVVSDAIDGVYERLILVSGDTDFVPALRMVRRRVPNIEIISAIPLGQHASPRLRNLADYQLKLRQSDYEPYRMPWNMALPDGTIRSCPAVWRTI
jgi:uncharacterized LabA/DUF88 family protein